MKNEELLKAREDQERLNVLQERLLVLTRRQKKQQEKAQELLEKYEKESLDVELIENGSFSATIFKLIGRYEEKHEKEYQEMLEARVQLEQERARQQATAERIAGLQEQLLKTQERLQRFQRQLEEKEQLLQTQGSPKLREQYENLCRQKLHQIRESAETYEALSAANRAQETIREAYIQLQGSYSHTAVSDNGVNSMAYYQQIDSFAAQYNRISAQLRELQKELEDVRRLDENSFEKTAQAAEAAQYWFSDLAALNEDPVAWQQADLEKIQALNEELDTIIEELTRKKEQTGEEIERLEEKRQQLLMNC